MWTGTGGGAPETYVDPEILKGGVNILTLKGTKQVPACLSGEALENYLQLRCDQKLQPGDYWRELHARKLDDEQLARLRYYDYLDTHVAFAFCACLPVHGNPKPKSLTT